MVTSAPTLGHGMDPRVPSRRMLGGILLGTLVAGAIAGELVATGRGIVVLAFVLLLVPVVIARNPDLAPAFVLAPALLIEQSPIDIGSGVNRITDHLPLFGGLGPSHLDGADPADRALHHLGDQGRPAEPRLPRSAIGTSLIVLEAAVVLGFGVGFSHEGDSGSRCSRSGRTCIWPRVPARLDARRSRRAIRLALWTMVLARRQGDPGPRDLPRGPQPGPPARGRPRSRGGPLLRPLRPADARLWLFEMRGPLRKTATIFLPIVIAADLGNSRRTAWLVLGAGVLRADRRQAMRACRRAACFLRRLVAGARCVPRRLPARVLEPDRRARPAGARDPLLRGARRSRRVVGSLPAAGEREPRLQHPRGGSARQRLRRAHRLRPADHGHLRHRPVHRLHPAQRRALHDDAAGRARLDRVLVAHRHRPHHGLPAPARPRSRGSPCSAPS